MQQQLIVKTSQSGWLGQLIIDDANVGIDPTSQSLFDMGRQANLSTREIVAVCVSCGMGFIGAGMVVLAFVDPEPTSKLALLIGSGAVLAITGGWSAINTLTKNKPPNIKFGKNGVEISWN